MVTSVGTNPFYNGEKKTLVCEDLWEWMFIR